jgi:propanol-preferring alcohol dehydrogenase
MRAVRVGDGGMSIEDVPVPEPGPGEVLIRVAGAGLCHSDVMISQTASSMGHPFTLGHETAGWVESLGAGSTGLETGQPVVVHAEWGCGRCWECQHGQERFCQVVAPAHGAGQGFDGGMAEYLLVPSSHLCVPLGDIDPKSAGPLDDAALTPYSAIRAARHRLLPGTVTVVIGIGGLGHLALQILRAVAPTTIVAVEPNESRRQFALELGADHAVDPSDDVAGLVRSLDPQMASVVLDLVGSEATLAHSATLVGRGGRVVLIGAALGNFPYSLISLPWGASIRTSYSGEVSELRELIALVQRSGISVHANYISLDDVPAAYVDLDRGGQPTGRLIAVP